MNLLARSLFQTPQPTLVIRRGLKRSAKIPITLAKSMPGLGSAGTVVYVNKAYMRHELYPKHLAEYVVARTGPRDRNAIAEKENIAPSRRELKSPQDVHSLALRNQDIISRIMGLEPLVFKRSTVNADENSKEDSQGIYGSLTKADVIKELEAKHGIIVDKSALSMDDKIKSTGNYTCTVKLIYAGQASLKCKVVSEVAEPQD
ncbi:hypothetical protein IWW48_005388 [Coemansia sp. RSA 1200]|nr:hypothetical protein IWW48_005388 [Coemansia sp. RSA 1200]